MRRIAAAAACSAAMLVVVSCLQQGRCARCAADVSRTAVAAAGTHTCATREVIGLGKS